MRTAAKIDDNQPEIVSSLRKAGYTVQSLAAVGNGCPDLLVGKPGFNYLLEVKDGAKVPSKRKLTEDQKVWHSLWKGPVYTVTSVEDALAIVSNFPL